MRFGIWRERIGGRIHAVWSEQGLEDQPPTSVTTLCNRRSQVPVEKFSAPSGMLSVSQLAEDFRPDQVCQTCVRLFS